jgi:hypothetical protein
MWQWILRRFGRGWPLVIERCCADPAIGLAHERYNGRDESWVRCAHCGQMKVGGYPARALRRWNRACALPPDTPNRPIPHTADRIAARLRPADPE